MRRVITPASGEWPEQLNDLRKGMPQELHLEGDDLGEMDRCIAIVGTRLASAAGLSLATRFARRFAEAGYTVVSGMARGIDTAAHRGALEAGGRTIAVMGCGLNLTYPQRNESLRKRIAAQGTLVSEYADDVPPDSFRFPQRNRIVAALSLGVVMIEGGLKSGALITARQALDLDRHVWSVPGFPGDPRGEGGNMLIRAGEAALVTDPDQVFEDVAPQIAWNDRYTDGQRGGLIPEGEDLEVLRILTTAPVTPDELMRHLDLAAGRIALSLTKLEVKGLAASTRGGAYRLTEAGTRVIEMSLST
jgi:DNA processing protein